MSKRGCHYPSFYVPSHLRPSINAWITRAININIQFNAAPLANPANTFVLNACLMVQRGVSGLTWRSYDCSMQLKIKMMFWTLWVRRKIKLTKSFCKLVIVFFFPPFCIFILFSSPFQWEASAHLLTSGVVSHLSAAKRLDFMLPWKCTSCVIIRYCGPNGAHPLLYLVNMSHLICAAFRPCATPAERADERACERERAGLSIVCVRVRVTASLVAPREREHCHAFVWKCVHYEPR